MSSITIAGGVYREKCLRPAWHEFYGSAGRAASVIASLGGVAELHAFMDPDCQDVLESRGMLERFKVVPQKMNQSLTFSYIHGLDSPQVFGDVGGNPDLVVRAENVLCFGAYERDVVVTAGRVVYDPQNVNNPADFYANGSSAEELALVLNSYEASKMSFYRYSSAEDIAKYLCEHGGAKIVVLKQGARGALVYSEGIFQKVPAYKSSSVWKIGSGDVFSANFAYRWLIENKSPTESARMASLATAYYSETRGFANSTQLNKFTASPIAREADCAKNKPIVYLAGPFFTLAELWLVEQAKSNLEDLGLEVFSPYHAIGPGAAHEVAQKDLIGLDRSNIVFAIGDGMDSGTVFEIGYAIAKGKKVVMYCENETTENIKMMEGTNCYICNDYVTAIYHTLWLA